MAARHQSGTIWQLLDRFIDGLNGSARALLSFFLHAGYGFSQRNFRRVTVVAVIVQLLDDFGPGSDDTSLASIPPLATPECFESTGRFPIECVYVSVVTKLIASSFVLHDDLLWRRRVESRILLSVCSTWPDRQDMNLISTDTLDLLAEFGEPSSVVALFIEASLL